MRPPPARRARRYASRVTPSRPPRRRPAAARALLVLAGGSLLAAAGCLTVSTSPTEVATYRERLDALYPPGALHTAAQGYDAERLDTIRVPEETSAEAVPGPADRRFLRVALGELRREELGPVAGFDRYERRERPGEIDAGAPAEPRTVCDLVFFDDEGRILRAYRRFAPCAR